MVHTFLDGVAGYGLMILVHSTRAPSDPEWNEYFSELRKHDPVKIKNLAFTDGGAPTGSQRRMVNDYLDGRSSQGAVVTHSPIVRGVVAALNWFNPEIRAFAPKDLDAALRFLGVLDSDKTLV